MEKLLYDIHPAVSVPLKRVTVGGLAVLERIGVFNDKDNALNEVKELYLKPKELFDFVKAVFVLTEEQRGIIEKELLGAENIEEIDIIVEEIVRGYWDFFDKLQPSNERLLKLLKPLMDSALKTETS